MPVSSRYLAICLAAGGVSAPIAALAEPADADLKAVAATTPPPAQVTYQFTVTTRGTSVESAPSTDDAIFGTVTLACLAGGGAVVVSRDVRHLVRYRALIRTPPNEDLGLQAYSRVFSELRRIAWNVCTPNQPAPHGDERTVQQKGEFAVGGFRFPSDITIQDRLGSIGCEAAPSDKTCRAYPCISWALPQPFVSTLSRLEDP